MDLTRDQILEICKDVCPNCKVDAPVRRRQDTGEYTHDWVVGTGQSHVFCLAHHLRFKHRKILDG